MPISLQRMGWKLVQQITVEYKERQAHTALLHLTGNEPRDLVHICGDGRGLEVWMKLFARFDPMSASRKCNMVKSILQPKPLKDVDGLPQAIVLWCGLIDRYEQ